MMLRTTNDQATLWESILPAEVWGLPAELERVDALLDDPAFFAPFADHFDPVMGRASIPIETYLRMMFLKFRYRLGFETLCREVTDSISWRRFCRIPLDAPVPHPTTLMKLTARCGAATVEQLNEALWAKAAQHKVLRTHRVRADTTVVEADVEYPTDSGLLATAVGRIGRQIRKVHAAGGATRTKVRDRSRAAGRRVRSIAANLRRRSGGAKDEVRRITGELAELAETAAGEAAAVVRNARRALSRAGEAASGRLRRAVADLEQTLERTARVVAQTRTRLSGATPAGASRLVSLHDPDARPIPKGRLGRPVEFGYKAQVTDNDDGVVVDYSVEQGNPPDAPQLKPAVERVTRRAGRPPRAVTADRGYGDTKTEQDLVDAGVERVAIPRKGKPSKARRDVEHSRPFRRLVKWRTGSEGRISYLKRGYGWNRTRLRGLDGARTWCGHGVFAHNLVKIGMMIQ
jgi:IS5 family transposase